MAKRSILDFKSQLSGGGLRANMFEVEFALPNLRFVDLLIEGKPSFNAQDLLNQYRLLCQSAQLPASNMTTITYGIAAGGSLKLPGSRTFDPFTCSFINDKNMRVRRIMELWSESIIGYQSQLTIDQVNRYLGTIDLYQLDRTGARIKLYKLNYAYPTNISAEEKSYENNNSYTSFDIQFNYQYFTTADLTVDRSGDNAFTLR